MPGYHECLLDHVGVAVRKNVFWPDQVPSAPCPPRRSRSYSSSRGLLGVLYPHRDSYTVSPTPSTSRRSRGVPPHVLSRSRSYTQSHGTQDTSRSGSSLSSSFSYSTTGPSSLPATPTPSKSVRFCPTSPVQAHCSPTTSISTSVGSWSHFSCGCVRSRAHVSAEPETLWEGGVGCGYDESMEWHEGGVQWAESCIRGPHNISDEINKRSSIRRCATTPSSPVRPSYTKRPQLLPPSASPNPIHTHPHLDEEEPGGDDDQWVLCTLGRPRSHSNNRRVQKMNEMSLASNTAQYQQWLQDTPKTSKGGAFISRARSFKGKIEGKLIGMKSPMRPPSRIVKVEPSSTNDTLNGKVEHVWRALDFYKDVVEKSTMDMLPGSASVVLEMIVALNIALKPAFPNQNSSTVSSVIGRVHYSVAELVRWSDQLLLHGDEARNTQTVQQVVQAVRDAVQALVDLAADKENLNLSDSNILDSTPSSIDNNNSINSDKTSSYYRNSDSVSSSSHRNSLPEIKPESPVEKSRNFLVAHDSSTKLSHSQSSDSILNSTDVESPPPKPPLPPGRPDVAPPLPPKKKTYNRGIHTENGVGNPMYLTSPLGHSSPLNRSPRESTTDWSHSTRGNALFTSSLDRNLRILSTSSQMSPASSLDSVNQSQDSHDDPSPYPMSLNTSGLLHDHLDLDFDRAIHKHFRVGDQHFQLNHRSLLESEPPSISFPDSGLPSISSMHSISSSTGYTSSLSSHSIVSQTSKSTIENHSMKQSSCTQMYYSSSSSSQVSSKVTCSSRLVAYQQTTTRSSTSSSASSSSIGSEGEKMENHTMSIAVPPALPVKKRTQQGRRSTEVRAHSTYDNVMQEGLDKFTVDNMDLRCKHKEDPSPKLPPKAGTLQLGESSSSSTTSMISNSSTSSSQGSSNVVQPRRPNTMFPFQSDIADGDEKPPPLPAKKKPVMEYMKLFGQVSEPNESDLWQQLRHSVHQMQVVQSSEWHSYESDQEIYHCAHLSGGRESLTLQTPPALPPKQRRVLISQGMQSIHRASELLPATHVMQDPQHQNVISPDNYEVCLRRKSIGEKEEPEEVIIQDQSREVIVEDKEEEVQEEEEGPLDMLDVTEYLILKKEGDDGPDIRGGPIDALIVQASKVNKNDFLYQEAFLTTYRTFISPADLVDKLLFRYNKFSSAPDVDRQKAARNAFSLLVRVVDELTITDLNIPILETLTEFEYKLLCRGELLLARALRRKIVEKLESRKQYNAPKESLVIASLSVTTRQALILDFKSHEIAEQMTLLDADLFHYMEIPEVLLWAQEQNEERSPNLTKFTEHFNKMSYWARSRILEQEDGRDREKYVMKFIKIMKHLRKMNNFNSYLALLSALDSAPIRRLEWQRNITDGLKEYVALIDSSSSFRAYRQALSESAPPCIPYIGLILQDLTFVDIGNNQNMADGTVNFSKRWQQFNILDNMKRFKKCQYMFKKNEKIIAFFNNFDDYLNEEALWHISEGIKPRGGKKK